MYLKQIQLGNSSAMAREVMNLRLSQAGKPAYWQVAGGRHARMHAGEQEGKQAGQSSQV